MTFQIFGLYGENKLRKILSRANHAATPYSVSSLLVPPDVPADADGVAYMVRVFKLRNPYAPGGDYGDMAYQGQAMKFLIENDVRQKASRKLQAEVAVLLKREVI